MGKQEHQAFVSIVNKATATYEYQKLFWTNFMISMLSDVEQIYYTPGEGMMMMPMCRMQSA